MSRSQPGADSDVHGGNGSCPAAVLVAIDATPALGLRGPTDFFGRADMALLREVHRGLLQLATRHK